MKVDIIDPRGWGRCGNRHKSKERAIKPGLKLCPRLSCTSRLRTGGCFFVRKRGQEKRIAKALTYEYSDKSI